MKIDEMGFYNPRRYMATIMHQVFSLSILAFLLFLFSAFFLTSGFGIADAFHGHSNQPINRWGKGDRLMKTI